MKESNLINVIETEVVNMHEYLMSYRIKHNIMNDPYMAEEFHSIVDYLMRSYIRFCNATLEKTGYYETTKQLDYVRMRIDLLEARIKSSKTSSIIK
ncbi:hypothetical protein [Thermoactinomyces sp. DSM 45892]|uniref:hypothetical protein n=1 Tax=Thermoactinomyces sp. DSM 45892 TaxID=1882753 RepID=UPI0008960358|nr:hypothetical protein [Thermoactinomyces sp. DSM 45892]SDY87022.1 hypothetical protein SAMN05444416_109125 [Thermoactinomyces sp. DSM 45892]